MISRHAQTAAQAPCWENAFVDTAPGARKNTAGRKIVSYLVDS